MSVRRLADEAVQPRSFGFSEPNQRWAETTIGRFPEGRQQSAIIPLLMRAQVQEGWLSRAAIERVAGMLDMPYIRALEVATFYTQFQLQPVGSNGHIQVCGTTPCMLRGSEALLDLCRTRIAHDPHTLSPDGTLSWEEVECMGACVNAPMVAIGEDTYEDLTPERFEQIIECFAAGQGASIQPGSQIGRQHSAPVTGPTTLVAANQDEKTSSPGGAAADQEPTTKGRPRNVTEESAPAIKGPGPQAKVSQAQAEGERQASASAAGADGTPNTAMREDATGAESPAGKIDAGAASGKETSGGRAAGALSTGTKPSQADAAAPSQGATPDVDTKQGGASGGGGPAVQPSGRAPNEPTAEKGGGERGPESVTPVNADTKGDK